MCSSSSSRCFECAAECVDPTPSAADDGPNPPSSLPQSSLAATAPWRTAMAMGLLSGGRLNIQLNYWLNGIENGVLSSLSLATKPRTVSARSDDVVSHSTPPRVWTERLQTFSVSSVWQITFL